LSPISTADGNPATAVKRLPIGRGGRVISGTAYQLFGQPYEWTYSDAATLATRVRGDFYTCAADLTNIQAHPFIWFNNLGGNGYKGVLFGADIMAYVALNKYNVAPVDLPRRDLYARLAMEMWAQAVCLVFDEVYAATKNPHVYAIPVSGWAFSSGFQVSGRRCNYAHYRLKHGGDVMQLARLGFGTEAPDTEAPTETQLLALVSKTDTQIVVDGPAATDNVGVVAYRFFKDGAQDGPDQAGTSHTYPGLSASTTYSLKRRALDAIGNVSGDSNTLSIQTNAAADTTPPSLPVIDTPRTVGQDFITYTWSESIDTESSLLRYRFSFDGGADEFVLPPTRTITKSGLLPATLHTGKVRAEDTQGNVNPTYSAQVSDTTLATSDTTPPSKPGDPEVTARTSTTLTIDFTPATDDVAVVDYVITCSAGTLAHDGSAVAGFSVVDAAPPTTITGLQPFATYPTSVLARDTVNESESSATVDLLTLRLARAVTTGSRLRATVLPIIAYPCAVGLDFYPTALAAGFLWSMASSTSENDWLAVKLLASGQIQAIRSNVTGFTAGATAVGTYTINTWNSVIAIFESATRCTIRLNTDSEAGEETVSKTFPVGLDRETVGVLDRPTPFQHYAGRVANRVLWNEALDAVAQRAFLDGGDPWNIRGGALVSYVPLYGQDPEPDIAGSADMTLLDVPTTADGPERVLNLTDPTPPGPPQPPTNLAVSALGATTVSISFTPGADSTGTRVRRLDTSVVFELTSGETLFVDNGLLPFTRYTYTFAGTAATLESAQTAPFEITTRPVHQTPATGRTLRSGVTPKG
jgi:hypothetical protein